MYLIDPILCSEKMYICYISLQSCSSKVLGLTHVDMHKLNCTLMLAISPLLRVWCWGYTLLFTNFVSRLARVHDAFTCMV